MSAPSGAAAARIRELGLAPHPEGGWYREILRSPERVVRAADGATRSAFTQIWFLLAAGEFSRWHRVLSDEVWLHVDGGPLELLQFAPGGAMERDVLGARAPTGRSDEETLARARHARVPAGHWQAARALGDWTLVNCTVAPGFEFEDFVMLRDLPAAGRPAPRDPDGGATTRAAFDALL